VLTNVKQRIHKVLKAMTVFNFADLLGKTTAFNAAADVLAFSAVEPSTLTFAESSGSVIITNAAGASATLSGVTLSQFATGAVNTSATANLLFSGVTGKAIFGDDSVGSSADESANTINVATVAGNHVLFGLGGADAITTGTVSSSVTLFGGSGIVDTVDGSDTITSTSATSKIYANAGNDLVTITPTTAASVWGGLGNDSINTGGAGAGTAFIAAGLGNDSVNLNGGGVHSGMFTIFGGTGEVDTLDGNDTIVSGTGGGKVYGNAGNDTVTLNALASSSIYGGLGNDTITGSVGAANTAFDVRAGSGTDTITLTLNTGVAAGSKNTATVYGGNEAGDSTDGADSITINGTTLTTSVVVYGNAGNDTIAVNNDVASTVFGGLGNDGITTTDLADSINAGDGNDTIVSGAGAMADTVDGGAGNDSITSAATGAGSAISIVGGAGDDTVVTGNYTSGIVNLGEGNDTISGSTAVLGSNTIIGGLGNDTVTFQMGASASATIWGGSSVGDSADGADSITVTTTGATAATATIDGGAGNDTINALDTGAGGAKASIDGGVGNDSITGDDDALVDTLVGGEGSDTITGASGADLVTLGAGSDTYKAAVATVGTQAAVVTISDFTTDDKFDFTDLTLTGLNGTGAGVVIGNGTTTTAVDANTGLFIATNAATSLTAANILTAISALDADADLTAGGDNNFYLLISDNTNAALVLVDDTLATANDILAGDITFVATYSGVTAATLATFSAANFADWS
jgi:Ca2+-binding RTX toxin-like protein